MCNRFQEGTDYGAGELSREEADILNRLTQYEPILMRISQLFWGSLIGGVIAWILLFSA